MDVRVWARKGLLTGNRFFNYSWSRGGGPTGSIGVNVTPQSAVTPDYSLIQNGERRSISERVALIYKPCNFGGARPWFQCPRCARQVAVLYMRSGRFACSHCQRVSYSSQSEDVMARTWREQLPIEEKIGEDWRRSKGVRLRTYGRLRDRLADCELRRDEAFCVTAYRLIKSLL